MNRPVRPSRSSFSDIEILHPLPLTPQGDPQPCAVDNSCCINADGFAGLPILEIVAVRGRVGDVAAWTPGTFYQLTWEVQHCARAFSSVVNTFHLELDVLSQAFPNSVMTETRSRAFVGQGGGSSCGSSGFFLTTQPFGPGTEPLDVAMPRYLRVRVSIGGPEISPPGQSILGSGLLQATSIYLAYDPIASRDTEGVWRDLNLPSDVGAWTLRVHRRQGKLCAQLFVQRLTTSQVLQPVSFETGSWCFLRENVFGCNMQQADRLGLPRGQSAVIIIDAA